MKILSVFKSPVAAGALAGCALFGAVMTVSTLARAQVQAERIIKITARKFDFTPSQIVLKKGQPVVFELSSADRVHGFRIKALNVRADVLPGQVVRVRVTPEQAGVFAFACDLFCGSGHEDMSGTITVTD